MTHMAEEDGQFEDNGWMKECLEYILEKDQVLMMLEDDMVTAYLGYWQFGNKRFKYIKNIRNVESCPKQMSKGKHLYIPITVVRFDKRGNSYMQQFLTSLKKRVPGAQTICWHDTNGNFRIHKVIRGK